MVEVSAPAVPTGTCDASGRTTREAQIPEYWIVNPIDETVTVLVRAADRYADHGVFRRGRQARSVGLSDCSLDVTSLFDAQ